MMSPQSSGGLAPQQRVVAERRWRLGVHSRGHPHRIIDELLRALVYHTVAYKKMAPYNFKCRKVYPARGGFPMGSAKLCCSGIEACFSSNSVLPTPHSILLDVDC
jgi:hypothetical protein